MWLGQAFVGDCHSWFFSVPLKRRGLGNRGFPSFGS
jgi:hypothetical protein